jgi:group I intron endonuclease
MFIYLITNKNNGKLYVGQTINDPIQRFMEHCWDVSRSVRPLQNAIKKYGKDNFTIEVLAKATSLEELSQLEKHFIKELNTRNKDIGYNLTEGGEGVSGYIPTKEVRERISLSQKKRFKDRPESNYMKGRVGELSPFYGKKHSEETIQIMSLSKLGENNPFHGHAHPRRRPIVCINKDLTESRYNCAYSAANALNLDPREIHKVCKGKRKTHKGYSFYYDLIDNSGGQ